MLASGMGLSPGAAGTSLGAPEAEGEEFAFFIPKDQRLAFQSFPIEAGPWESKLYTVDPSISPSTPIAVTIGDQPESNFAKDPDWSRDGSLLIFSRAGSLELGIVNAFTGQQWPIRYPDGTAVYGHTPQWVHTRSRDLCHEC